MIAVSKVLPCVRRAGFSLVELLCALLIIGIVTSVAIPAYAHAVDGYRAEAAARRIAADLNRARRDAKLAGVSREVIFTIGLNYYDLPGMADPDHPSVTPYRVELAETPYPATLISVVFERAGGNDDRVLFDMYGQATTQDLPLTRGTIVVQSGNTQRTVTVDPVTGEATLP